MSSPSDVLTFTALCRKCGKSPTQSYSRASLRQRLDDQEHIEFYCSNCEFTRHFDAEERNWIRRRLDGSLQGSDRLV
jgi:hypothetical protein